MDYSLFMRPDDALMYGKNHIHISEAIEYIQSRRLIPETSYAQIVLLLINGVDKGEIDIYSGDLSQSKHNKVLNINELEVWAEKIVSEKKIPPSNMNLEQWESLDNSSEMKYDCLQGEYSQEKGSLFMPFSLSQDEIRKYCKDAIESLEHWLRRLVDETLTNAHGDNYIDAKDNNGQNIINNSIKKEINDRISGEPTRYSRPIDATVLETLIKIVCNPELYSNYFKDALKNAFPLGNEEARRRLESLKSRKGRVLTYQAKEHFKKIVNILNFTDKCMYQIEKLWKTAL